MRFLPGTRPSIKSSALLHDRIIGALELCCRRGEMLLIQNRRVYWDTHQIGISGSTAKDRENRRVPFDSDGRLAAILKRRESLGPLAYAFGTPNGEYQANIQTVWETLKLLHPVHRLLGCVRRRRQRSAPLVQTTCSKTSD